MNGIADMKPKTIIKFASAAVILLIIITAMPFSMVRAGQRGVVVNLGAVTGTILNEGLHWRTPLVTAVIKIDVRTQKEEVDAQAATKDLQNVFAKVALNYHLDPTKVSHIYQTVGDNAAVNSKIIAPSLQESIKATSAKFTAEELITKREQVRDDISSNIKEKFSGSGVIVDGFNIVNFKFSQSFDAAIEAKVTAEQNALAAKNKLEQVKFEAQQSIEKAKAEAESIRIQAQAINAQGGAHYVQLKAIEKWSGILPTQMIPGSTVPFLNLTR